MANLASVKRTVEDAGKVATEATAKAAKKKPAKEKAAKEKTAKKKATTEKAAGAKAAAAAAAKAAAGKATAGKAASGKAGADKLVAGKAAAVAAVKAAAARARVGKATKVESKLSRTELEAILDARAEAKGLRSNWRESLSGLMKALDMSSSLASRKALAVKLKYSGDDADGSTEKDNWLHAKLLKTLAKNGGELPPDLL